MKTKPEFTLQGKDWWKPFLPFWFFYLIYTGFSQLSQRGSFVQEQPFAYFLVTLLLTFAMIAASSILTIVVARIALPKLSFEGKGFAFRGDIAAFLGTMLLGFFLSLITLFIYMPWFVKKVTGYLVAETTFDGKAIEFHGKAGKLFKYWMLAFVVPFIVVIAIFTAVITIAVAGGGSPATVAGASGFIIFATFLIMIPLIYLMYKWFVDLSCDGVHVGWKTEFWPSCLYILGQVCLTLITIGIYWPAATIKLYRYFAARTVLEKEGREIGRFAFEGAMGKGFGLLWGQALLCLITIGIYVPWAYANVWRWLIGETAVEVE